MIRKRGENQTEKAELVAEVVGIKTSADAEFVAEITTQKCCLLSEIEEN